MKTWTIEEESRKLAERFRGINRAAFARDYGVPGGGTMIFQHINNIRPISREAAQAYARGFGCKLEEISPRLALEAKKTMDLSGATTSKSHISLQLMSEDQLKILELVKHMDAETVADLLKVVSRLEGKRAHKPRSRRGVKEEQAPVESPSTKTWPEVDRRKEDVGHMPDRRRHFGIPPNMKRRPKKPDPGLKREKK